MTNFFQGQRFQRHDFRFGHDVFQLLVEVEQALIRQVLVDSVGHLKKKTQHVKIQSPQNEEEEEKKF